MPRFPKCRKMHFRWLSRMVPLMVPLALAMGAEIPAILPSIRSVNLQMTRNGEQDSAQLNLELVTRFSDGQLLGWSDVQILSAEGPEGHLDGTATGTLPQIQNNHNESEDDLSVPLTVEFSGFIRPPTLLKKIRISATALISHGTTRELALPENANDRTFAPADDRKATVSAKLEKDHWRLEMTGPLAERCVRVVLRRADGTEMESNLNQNQSSPQRSVIDLRSNNGDLAGSRPVLILVEKIERRAVIIAAEQLELFGSSADPEMLPLGGDPAAPKAKVVPSPDQGMIDVVPPAKAVVPAKAK